MVNAGARSQAKLAPDAQATAAGAAPAAPKSRRKSVKSAPDDVSRVLRTVYDDTLREQVPDDFMDLLGKLS